MDYDRALELLNLVVDHITVAHTTKETLQKLLHIGFLESELINVFHFREVDVMDAASDMESYVDE